jgi:polyhydroxybutyrate depolymerase
MRRLFALLISSALVVSCSSGDDTARTTESAATATTTAVTDPASTVAETSPPDDTVADTVADTSPPAADPTIERPFDVFAPTSYDPATPTPLVIMLHAFGATSDLQEVFFQLQPLAEERGFLYVRPNGTINAIGRGFWNATDACCGFGATVDDSAYLLKVIEKVEAEFNVDPKRIFLVGHSNGGFMSYRMACDHADKIAAIASLAGATFADVEKCDPSEPVSVLQIHGTADGTIAYDGGSLLGIEHPSAPVTAATWAAYDGCDATSIDAAGALDLDVSLAGNDTSTASYEGCPPGIAVELWTIEGGAHIPLRTDDMSIGIIDFLFAHPKP